MRKLLFIVITLFVVAITVDNYQTHKALSVYKRGEEARISVEAAKLVNNTDTTANDTASIIKLLQGREWNR